MNICTHKFTDSDEGTHDTSFCRDEVLPLRSNQNNSSNSRKNTALRTTNTQRLTLCVYMYKYQYTYKINLAKPKYVHIS